MSETPLPAQPFSETTETTQSSKLTIGRQPKVIAHRGASTARRENTLDAFREAVRLGADGVELDVRRTANNVLVAHHDAHLMDGRAIVDLSDDELPEWVPTLAEVMEVCHEAACDRKFIINIEIKSTPGDPDYDAKHQVSAAVAGVVLGWGFSQPVFSQPVSEGSAGTASHGAQDAGDILDTQDAADARDGGIGIAGLEIIVSSFDMEALNRIKAIDPSICTSYLTFEVLAPELLVGRVAAGGHNVVSPYVASTSSALVAAAHDVGLEVNVWTVNEPDQITHLAAIGVDAVITDVPDIARAVLG